MVCTVNQAIERALYYMGYCEKASSNYASSNDKSVFELNRGSNNYTYFGDYCGLQGQPYCAMFITTAITEACGSKSDARKIMHGVWPYTACDQLYNAAPNSCKGERGSWVPKPGDVVIFNYPNNNTRHDHTGIIVSVSDGCTATSGTIVVAEGNSSNMCKKNTYSVSNSNIYRYVRLLFADSPVVSTDTAIASSPKDKNFKIYYCNVKSQIIQSESDCSKGYCKSVQALLNAKINAGLDLDGEFGPLTKSAIMKFQEMTGLEVDGSAGTDTQSALMKY